MPLRSAYRPISSSQSRGQARTEWGGEADRGAVLSEPLDLAEVLGDRRLAEAIEPAAPVGGVEEDELDRRRLRRLGRGHRLVEAEVMELADRSPAGAEHLPVHRLVGGAHALRGLDGGELEHRLAPGPEVAAAG
jgi:hypothetical protein